MSATIGSKIFECQYVSKAWNENEVILKDFYYNFARFEKMGIVGNNGTGKSGDRSKYRRNVGLRDECH